MKLQRELTREIITLTKEIASGGEGIIYTVKEEPKLVAKIYRCEKLLPEHQSKLEAMLKNPMLHSSNGTRGHIPITWIVDLLVDLKTLKVVGYLMPRLQPGMVPLHNCYNANDRRQKLPLFHYGSLHRVALNLATVINAIHKKGYVIGDINESNICVGDKSLVTVIDTDSFQVRDGSKTYRCLVAKGEYVPPELTLLLKSQGKTYKDVDRVIEHDLFGLAVIIFQLLMNGTHPFDGVYTGKGEQPKKPERITAGYFPYGTKAVPFKPRPIAPSIEILHPELKALFIRCFEGGYSNPRVRPTAEEWQKALGKADKNLIRCSLNSGHYYGNHLKICPWCKYVKQRKGTNAFSPNISSFNAPQKLSQGTQTKKQQTAYKKQNSIPQPFSYSPKSHAAQTRSSSSQASSNSQNNHALMVVVSILIFVSYLAFLSPTFIESLSSKKLFSKMQEAITEKITSTTTTPVPEQEVMDTVDRVDNLFCTEGTVMVAGSGGIDLRTGQTHTMIMPLIEGGGVRFDDANQMFNSSNSANEINLLVSVIDPSGNSLRIDEPLNYENSLDIDAEYTGDYEFIFRLPDGVEAEKLSLGFAWKCP
jgi:serine/threonine protein kinase